MKLLTLNCGSSSVKYSVIDARQHQILARGCYERITLNNSVLKHEINDKKFVFKVDCPSHEFALKYILKILCNKKTGLINNKSEILGIGHRVVHGGEFVKESVLITDKIIKIIEDASVLAPLHNPPNLQGIRTAIKLLPNIPQVAVFDTAFHQTIPDYAYVYPLPYKWYRQYRVRRYGFHGTSHKYVSKRACKLLNKLSARIITLHIGNGVSVSAIDSGKCIDTSMGFTPLEGAIMGTRCGDIDPAIIFYIMDRENITLKDLYKILNEKSGLFGITGEFMDRRDIEKHAKNGCSRCILAINMEAYRLKKYIGAYTAALGGLDAIVFTAGAGENSPLLREKILTGLEFLGVKFDKMKNSMAKGGLREEEISSSDSNVKVFVIPTQEELMIAEETLTILNKLKISSHDN
jgi:acetate kinase